MGKVKASATSKARERGGAARDPIGVPSAVSASSNKEARALHILRALESVDANERLTGAVAVAGLFDADGAGAAEQRAVAIRLLTGGGAKLLISRLADGDIRLRLHIVGGLRNACLSGGEEAASILLQAGLIPVLLATIGDCCGPSSSSSSAAAGAATTTHSSVVLGAAVAQEALSLLCHLAEGKGEAFSSSSPVPSLASEGAGLYGAAVLPQVCTTLFALLAQPAASASLEDALRASASTSSTGGDASSASYSTLLATLTPASLPRVRCAAARLLHTLSEQNESLSAWVAASQPAKELLGRLAASSSASSSTSASAPAGLASLVSPSEHPLTSLHASGILANVYLNRGSSSAASLLPASEVKAALGVVVSNVTSSLSDFSPLHTLHSTVSKALDAGRTAYMAVKETAAPAAAAEAAWTKAKTVRAAKRAKAKGGVAALLRGIDSAEGSRRSKKAGGAGKSAADAEAEAEAAAAGMDGDDDDDDEAAMAEAEAAARARVASSSSDGGVKDGMPDDESDDDEGDSEDSDSDDEATAAAGAGSTGAKPPKKLSRVPEVRAHRRAVTAAKQARASYQLARRAWFAEASRVSLALEVLANLAQGASSGMRGEEDEEDDDDIDEDDDAVIAAGASSSSSSSSSSAPASSDSEDSSSSAWSPKATSTFVARALVSGATGTGAGAAGLSTTVGGVLNLVLRALTITAATASAAGAGVATSAGDAASSTSEGEWMVSLPLKLRHACLLALTGVAERAAAAIANLSTLASSSALSLSGASGNSGPAAAVSALLDAARNNVALWNGLSALMEALATAFPHGAAPGGGAGGAGGAGASSAPAAAAGLTSLWLQAVRYPFLQHASSSSSSSSGDAAAASAAVAELSEAYQAVDNSIDSTSASGTANGADEEDDAGHEDDSDDEMVVISKNKEDKKTKNKSAASLNASSSLSSRAQRILLPQLLALPLAADYGDEGGADSVLTSAAGLQNSGAAASPSSAAPGAGGEAASALTTVFTGNDCGLLTGLRMILAPHLSLAAAATVSSVMKAAGVAYGATTAAAGGLKGTQVTVSIAASAQAALSSLFPLTAPQLLPFVNTAKAGCAFMDGEAQQQQRQATAAFFLRFAGFQQGDADARVHSIRVCGCAAAPVFPLPLADGGAGEADAYAPPLFAVDAATHAGLGDVLIAALTSSSPAAAAMPGTPTLGPVSPAAPAPASSLPAAVSLSVTVAAADALMDAYSSDDQERDRAFAGKSGVAAVKAAAGEVKARIRGMGASLDRLDKAHAVEVQRNLVRFADYKAQSLRALASGSTR